MNKLLIKNGILLSANNTMKADILIEGSTIKKVGINLSDPEATHIDATGKYIFPGFIDPHTHLDLTTSIRTADNFESGTLGALSGGTTTILDFATQEKGETLTEALANWHHLADGRSSCHYGFHMAISDWNDSVKAEMVKMREAGITSFKLYMAYDSMRLGDRAIFEVMTTAKELGALVSMHCENGDLVDALIAREKAAGHLSPAAHPLSRPDYVEAEAINRFLAIAEAADAPTYVVHLSTRRGLKECLHAMERGQKVIIESCPQYFLLDDTCYQMDTFEESAKYVFAPPARKLSDQRALWKALAKNQIQTIGSDHCSFNLKGGKDLGRHDFSQIPNGIPGVETRPVLMYTYGVCEHKLSLNQMAGELSENVAKIFGMYPQKGALLAGSDADIVIWDPAYKGEITAAHQYQNVDYTPYEGLAVQGRAYRVILSGKVVVEDGKVLHKNNGKYVHRLPCLS